MLLGGSGPDGLNREVLERYVELAGGPRGLRVLVVPAASEVPRETAQKYVVGFERQGVESVGVLDVRSRREADEPGTCERLEQATAVMFTGGDQARLLEILDGSRLLSELRRRWIDGMMVGGSSAGAMALGDPCIVRGEPAAFYRDEGVRVQRGLGLLAGTAVDSHAVSRSRLERLLPVMAAYPEALGIGVEEDTAAFVSPDDTVHVCGAGVVCVFDGRGMGPGTAAATPGRRLTVEGLVLHVLAPGDEFDLAQRRFREEP